MMQSLTWWYVTRDRRRLRVLVVHTQGAWSLRLSGAVGQCELHLGGGRR